MRSWKPRVRCVRRRFGWRFRRERERTPGVAGAERQTGRHTERERLRVYNGWEASQTSVKCESKLKYQLGWLSWYAARVELACFCVCVVHSLVRSVRETYVDGHICHESALSLSLSVCVCVYVCVCCVGSEERGRERTRG